MILELIKSQVISVSNGKKTIGTVNKYTGVLFALMSDCPSMQQEVKRTSFGSRSFTETTKRYNGCIGGSEYNVEEMQKKQKLEFYILAGATFNHLNIEGSSSNKLDIINYSGSRNYTLGIGTNFILPHNRQKYSIASHLFFKPLEFTGRHSDDASTYKTKRVATFNASYLKLITVFNYSYPSEKIRPFLNCGFTFGYLLQGDSELVVTDYYANRENIRVREAMENFKKYEFGFTAGAGVALNRLRMECKYEVSEGFSPLINVSSTIGTVYFIIGAKLF